MKNKIEGAKMLLFIIVLLVVSFFEWFMDMEMD